MFTKLLDGNKECLCYPIKEILISCGSGDDVLAIGAGIEIGMNEKLNGVSRKSSRVESLGCSGAICDLTL